MVKSLRLPMRVKRLSSMRRGDLHGGVRSLRDRRAYADKLRAGGVAVQYKSKKGSSTANGMRSCRAPKSLADAAATLRAAFENKKLESASCSQLCWNTGVRQGCRACRQGAPAEPARDKQTRKRHAAPKTI